MLFKVVAYCSIIIPYAIGDLDYENYYGKHLFHILNVTWHMENKGFPLNLIFHELDENFIANNWCHRDFKKLKTSLNELETWAVEMADSCGGSIPGALSGNLINLGSYDECLKSGNNGAEGHNYCWIQLSVNDGFEQFTSLLPHNAPIIHSICVPGSCTPQDLDDLIRVPFAHFDVITTVKCLDKHNSWGALEISGVVFFSALCLFAVLSTTYDKFKASDYEGYNGLLCSFSVIRNMKDVMATSPNKFLCIDGIRVLTQTLIIIYHVGRLEIKNEIPFYNKFAQNKFFRSWEGVIHGTIPLAINTFFLIGGFLFMYSILSKENKKIFIGQQLLNRFVRLYPPYIITLFFVLTMSGIMCDGPLCNSITYSEQNACKNLWWTNALCIHNIYPGLAQSCMPHSWYLAVEGQMYFFLTPLIIIGVRESKSVTFWIIVAVTACSLVVSFVLTATLDLRIDMILYDSVADALQYNAMYYTNPAVRLVPWCMGLLFGYLMHGQKSNKIMLQKGQLIFLWTGTAIVHLAILFSTMPFYQMNYSYSNVAAAFYNTLCHPFWSLGVGWIIYSCSSGYGGVLNAFLTCTPFQVLGKLTYSAYLTHKIIISLYFSELRAPVYLSHLQQITLLLGMISLCFIVALFFYLIAEAPIGHVIKYLLYSTKQEPKNTTTSKDIGTSNDIDLDKLQSTEIASSTQYF